MWMKFRILLLFFEKHDYIPCMARRVEESWEITCGICIPVKSPLVFIAL